MSANPTRVTWAATSADQASPLEEGNRVLESIARREALRALLAFSDLHERIRNRRLITGRASARDLFETERFILDEVLQLICDRTQTIVQAEGVVIALAEGSEIVCRAAAGPLTIERGVRLTSDSAFLRECLDSGRILRCDHCATDPRVRNDDSRRLGFAATVLIPLRGRREQLGVLQAFSTTPRKFSDDDVRCLDLFAELVLSALKPEDQDRRITWLSDVAGDVLHIGPGVALPVHDSAGGRPAGDSVDEPENGANAEPSHSSYVLSVSVSESTEALQDLAPVTESAEDSEDNEPALAAKLRPRLALSDSSRPGLSVVIGLVAVAALFSAATWWGLDLHGKQAAGKLDANGGMSSQHTSPTRVRSFPQQTNSQSSATADRTTAESASDFSDIFIDVPKAGADAGQPTAALSKITGVRHWSSSTGSTVVIDMDNEVPYEVHRLVSPERIYFDLHDTALSTDLDGKTMDVGDTSLTRVRIGQPVTGVTRVVLDTKDGSNFSVSMESNPYRLVVELRPSAKASGDAPSASQTDSNQSDSNQSQGDLKQHNSNARDSNKTGALKPASSQSDLGKVANNISATNFLSEHTGASAAEFPALKKTSPVTALPLKSSEQPVSAKIGRFRIVLDAGHGGWDKGTVGRQGLLEKDLVLDVTERLGKLLQSRLGSDVMFTRTDDSYLPLDQRADIANQAQADLFVSVHANYSSSTSARGVETYYTNLFSAPGSREVEKHDDGTFTKLTPVSLSSGGLHEKIEESRRLAASVQRSLYATLAAKSPDIRNRGIKDSAFLVLTGTTMPSVLTEISFVSSPADEHNLQSASYRQQIAEALYQGIARYEQSAPKAKVAQLQSAVRH